MNRLRKARVLLVLALIMSLLEVSVSSQNQTAAFPACSGPTDSIVVVVAQLKSDPPIYSYRIKNLSSLSISAFVLGDGDRKEMAITPANVPEQIGSPKGWIGRSNFQEEGSFMNITWEAKSREDVVSPSGSKEGFKLVMPRPPAASPQLFDLYGKKVEPLSMKNSPFRVVFTDGNCQWGRTSEIQPQKEK